MEYLQIGNTKVDYDLRYTGRKKTIELVIDLNGGFTVKAPTGMKREDVVRNLHRKAKWIINNLDKMQAVIKYETKKEYVSGEKFPLLGKRYSLKVRYTTSKPSLAFKSNAFIAELPRNTPLAEHRKLLEPLFVKYYKERAFTVLNERVARYARQFKKKPGVVLVQDLKDKWGSCSKGNQMRYNWRIVLAKMSIIDYVVAHELCHLAHKDHSKAYWQQLKTIIPDYEVRKEWLRVNGDLLQL